ncbi:Predicted dehydrogenase [Maribacter aquivivus]|uniref:Predicted dehydrogenase n=1 Tax=Maribacter aquivivus TaxID=228958 RepID=A0A1M6LIK0_9FLAO|nr:Gfo/Idh/MocA family oxidoreductase [Maribacter aquivivus]SHJ71006.1 Predicted dehydrogenase [Maribacter aquivivus]
MEEINWGIIGCGDVAEVKSGPAFQRVANSNLLSVMRRNEEKAKDFAKRHNIQHWTSNPNDILNNKNINAVYIATPPSSHLKYALQALKAGKHVYLEKPMALNADEAKQICNALKNSTNKLTMAHYRRKLPAFLKVKELLEANSIGVILHIDLQVLQSKKKLFVANVKDNWRIQPAVSGGGYFYDLAPHHIDLMIYFFGPIDKVLGLTKSTTRNANVEEIVNGIISFQNGIQFRGIWNFNVAENNQKDQCIIYGSEGSIEFSFFGSELILKTIKEEQILSFTNPKHVQEPMIQATVDYFLGKEENPCQAEDGLLVMDTIGKLDNRKSFN